MSSHGPQLTAAALMLQPEVLEELNTLGATIGMVSENFASPDELIQTIFNREFDILITCYTSAGSETLNHIHKIHNFQQELPIILLADDALDQSTKLSALQMGATDFIRTPFDHAEFTARIHNLAKLRFSQKKERKRADWLENEIRKATNQVVDRELEALMILGQASEFRDRETSDHISRVAFYSRFIANALELPDTEQELIFHAAPLHDIGKLGIPDSILRKPGMLNPAEFDIMKRHTTIGYKILKHSKSPYLKAGSLIALTHHERYDGKGYPDGLVGEQIPIMGHVVSAADVFDALSTPRVYKHSWKFEDVLNYFLEQRGRQFHPDISDAVLARKHELHDIYEIYVADISNNEESLISAALLDRPLETRSFL